MSFITYLPRCFSSLPQHRTKYQGSGDLNIAETRGTVAETQRLTRVSVSGYITIFHVSVAAFSTELEYFFPRFRQISVSGITYFRNRYHVNKLRKREITFGDKFVSFSSFGGSVDFCSLPSELTAIEQFLHLLIGNNRDVNVYITE